MSLRLRVGAFQAPSLHRHPDADVSVEDLLSEHGLEEIAAGRLDLPVIASWDALPHPPPRVVVHDLLVDPMVVVHPDDHPLADRYPGGTSIGLHELRAESWVTIVAGHPTREQFDRAASEAGFTPRIRFRTASYAVAQTLVGTGIGVALVPRLTLTDVPGTTHRELAHPRLHHRLHAVAGHITATRANER